MTITKILVPIDGSSFSVKAFNVAIDIAKKHNAKLSILTCLEKDNLGAWYVDKRINKQIIQNAKKLALGYLGKLETRTKKSNIAISMNVVEAKSISQQIIAFANTKKIDLIVIGSHGRTGFKEFLLGSVTNAVSQSAKCPVLIVK